MGRSMKLGHCICNPRQACPCPQFLEKDICACAGEREAPRKGVRLTELVQKAGCASKIKQDDLKKILAGLPPVKHPDLLVGSGTCDDAGVFRLNDETALVQTVDVFTPNVDDPFLFGQIAAANSLSDVYAMGGRPITALAVIGFPVESLEHEVMTRILRGGMDKMAEAGAVVVGGHSINDAELKFGFAVTGLISPGNIISNAGARPGDMLLLTKPLGTGVISFAAQIGRAPAGAMEAAGRSMACLNRSAAEAMVEFGAHAATDVTGFGLMGHLGEMVVQSGVEAEIFVQQLPVFPQALQCLRQGMASGALESNRDFSSRLVSPAGEIEPHLEQLLYDPQTSGGLLIALPPEQVSDLQRRLSEQNVQAPVIGRISGRGRPLIRLLCGRADEKGRPMSAGEAEQPPQPPAEESCGSCCCCAEEE